MPQRLIRWVERDQSGVVHWNRVKLFSGRLDNEEISQSVADDRHSAWKFLSDRQVGLIHDAAVRVDLLVRFLAKGTLLRWHYDAEAGLFWFDEEFSVGGTPTTKRRETKDETLLEAGQSVLEAIASATSTAEKPVSAFEPKTPERDLPNV